MFLNKSFAGSSLFSRNKEQKIINPTLQTDQYQIKDQQLQTIKKQLERFIKQLQQTKRQSIFLNQELQQVKIQLQKTKQVFIETKIEHDKQVRAYDELIQQLRQQLQQKEQFIEENINQVQPQNKHAITKIPQEQADGDFETNQQNRNGLQSQRRQIQEINNQEKPPEISELMVQSILCYKKKYQVSINQVHRLKQQNKALKDINCKLSLDNQKLRTQNQKALEQLTIFKSKQNIFSVTNDISIVGNETQKMSFGFGDLTSELRQIEQIADFSHNPSHIMVDQEQITVREQRIQNLQRQAFELKHQLATNSHKLAHIFNAAFQYGGMLLLDHLQKAIGLVERTQDDQNR